MVQGVAGILLLVGALAVVLRGGGANVSNNNGPNFTGNKTNSETTTLTDPTTITNQDADSATSTSTSSSPSSWKATSPRGRDFVLQDLRDLYVCVAWWGLAGTYSAQLTFLLPDGNVYQTMTLAFVTPEAPATVQTVEVDGRQQEVKRAGRGRQGEALVVAMLPVAGTYISQYNFVGLWTVKVALNGQPVDQDSFVLHPQ